jgi:hypothetical protein
MATPREDGGPSLEQRRESEGTSRAMGGEASSRHGFAPPRAAAAPDALDAWRAIYLIEREAIALRRLRWRHERVHCAIQADAAARIDELKSLAKYMRPVGSRTSAKEGWLRRIADGLRRLLGLQS